MMSAMLHVLLTLAVFAAYAWGHKRGLYAGWSLARRFPCVRELSSLDK